MGALHYLSTRTDVDLERVMLQGWSNGASTALNVLAVQRTRMDNLRFTSALVMYPGCGTSAIADRKSYMQVPTTVLLAANDEEVSSLVCEKYLRLAKDAGAPVRWTTYEGATHGFDDPGAQRQSVHANKVARDDAFRQALMAARLQR
ncbi:MAG TPA: dienelactone hydrolase family protein [Burkholderiaceae bacterium]